MSDMRKSRPQAGKIHSKARPGRQPAITTKATQADVDAMLGIKNYRPRAGETPTTMPRHAHSGEGISEDRRRKKQIKAEFRAKHGRRMNAKAYKRARRLAKGG